MPEKIKNYIRSTRLLSWSMIDDSSFEEEKSEILKVYTASAFYAFDENNNALIIASHENTKHIHLAKNFQNVALNIAQDSSIATLKGLQIQAKFKEASKDQEKIYYEKFNFAKLSNAKCYALEIFYVKMTDNLSLNQKIEYKR